MYLYKSIKISNGTGDSDKYEPYSTVELCDGNMPFGPVITGSSGAKHSDIGTVHGGNGAKHSDIGGTIHGVNGVFQEDLYETAHDSLFSTLRNVIIIIF